MFLNTKFVLLLLLVLGAGFFGYREYRHRHPHYVPPPPREEVTLTIIPGWNLRQVAEYLIIKGLASSTQDVYKITGEPAVDYRPVGNRGPYIDLALTIFQEKKTTAPLVSYEGYIAPETIRAYKDASLLEVLKKIFVEREQQLVSDDVYPNIIRAGHSVHELLTMASIIEKEVKHNEDRAKVADILWRRLKKGWALQVDSSVHYAIDKTGTVFTTERERDIDSPWNTYKYPGLPPGPICNPSLESIKAALYPEKNEYWYFLSDKSGTMHYGRTLDEHNQNVWKYLRS